MKMKQSFKEYDMAYKAFDLSEKEVKVLSEYFGYEFKSKETHLCCVYDLKGNLLTAQVNENCTWDLSPEEVDELFGNKLAA